MLLELPLSDQSPLSGLVEQVNNFKFTVFGNETTRRVGLEEVVDHSPSWNCFHIDENDVQDLVRFQSIHTNFK